MGSCPLFLFRADDAAAGADSGDCRAGGARRAGWTIWDIQSRRETSGHVVRVFIDRPGPAATPEESVSIEDCEQVNREIEHDSRRRGSAALRLHAGGVVAGTRSAAARRRTTTGGSPDGWRRSWCSEPVDNQKAFEGRLRGVEQDDVLLEAPNGRMHRLPLRLITRGRLEVEF